MSIVKTRLQSHQDKESSRSTYHKYAEKRSNQRHHKTYNQHKCQFTSSYAQFICDVEIKLFMESSNLALQLVRCLINKHLTASNSCTVKCLINELLAWKYIWDNTLGVLDNDSYILQKLIIFYHISGKVIIIHYVKMTSKTKVVHQLQKIWRR